MGPDDGRSQEYIDGLVDAHGNATVLHGVDTTADIITSRLASHRPPHAYYSFPKALRYANAASVEPTPQAASLLSGRRLPFFCGELPPTISALFLLWGDLDRTTRVCDVWESPRNYKQFVGEDTDGACETDQCQKFFSVNSLVENSRTNLIAVAWGGRIFDTPADVTGATLNSGALKGTGFNTGTPGNIPEWDGADYIAGVSMENPALEPGGGSTFPTTFTPGAVPWTSGYRQALGCWPWKRYQTDTCLESAMTSGAVISSAAGGPWLSISDNAPGREGETILTTTQARAILTPVCDIAACAADPESATCDCPDKTGRYELIVAQQRDLIQRLGEFTPLSAFSLPCGYVNEFQLPLSDRELNVKKCVKPYEADCSFVDSNTPVDCETA
jgi:hypothetical protein